MELLPPHYCSSCYSYCYCTAVHYRFSLVSQLNWEWHCQTVGEQRVSCETLIRWNGSISLLAGLLLLLLFATLCYAMLARLCFTQCTYISTARHRCQRNISLSVRPTQPTNHPDSHQLSVKSRKKEIVCLNRAGRIYLEMEPPVL